MLLDCKAAAIEGLADLKARDPRYLQVLVEGMENDLPAIRFASVNALKAITGRTRRRARPVAEVRPGTGAGGCGRRQGPEFPAETASTTPAPPSDPAVEPARAARPGPGFQYVDQ